jgi:hypothetical protein
MKFKANEVASACSSLADTTKYIYIHDAKNTGHSLLTPRRAAQNTGRRTSCSFRGWSLREISGISGIW